MTGAPGVRRLKSYAAQTGFVYEYGYEGRRPYRMHRGETGSEYVFRVSNGGKSARPVSVFVADAALRSWEQAHARALTATEQYAIAKMALFQAFDERATPVLMKQAVRVRPADVTAILETLGIERED